MDDIALILTSRDDTRLAAERWCAAVGISPFAVGSAAEARRFWRSARTVVLDADQIPELQAMRWPRRDHVFLVVDEPDRWWQEAVQIGASGVLAKADDHAGVTALASVVDGGAEGCSIVVVGGRGGAGATTLACSLGLTAAARGLSAVVLDADPLGTGVELVLGTESVEGLRWRSLDTAAGVVAPAALAGALPLRSGLASLSWETDDDAPRVPDGAASVWSAATRGFDVVIVDQPRTVADDAWTGAVLGGSVLSVVVIDDDIGGIAAARRQIVWLSERTPAVAAVVARRGRGGLGRAVVESSIDVPVIATMRRDRRLQAAVDHGRGPGRSRPMNRLSRQVLDLVGLSKP